MVTGGAGFIGVHLARHLAGHGHHVVVCDNFFRMKRDPEIDELLTNDGVELVSADLASSGEIKERLPKHVDSVFHLAAINGTRHFYEIPSEVLRVNILTLMNILEWMRSGSAKRIIWTSSSEVHSGAIDLGKAAVPTGEEAPLCIIDPNNPRNSYAGSKIVGELLCANYGKEYGLDVTIVRPYNIYGPRMGFEHVIPEFSLRALRREDPFTINGAENTRSFCYVDDAVMALESIMMSRQTVGETLNVGNDSEEISMLELAKRIFKVFNFSPRMNIKPAPAGSVPRRCPKLNKIRTLTAYTPRVSLDEGLDKTCAWYEEWFNKNS